MKKTAIRDVIEDQAEERDRFYKHENLIEREQLDFYKDYVNNDLVKVTTGVRRSGKTVFTHLLLQNKRYASVNFDDERLAFAEKEDLNNILEALYQHYGDFKELLLDEVQNIYGWELFVNRLQRSKINLFITGSNANLLSQELSTHLTGRTVQIEMLPFSFGEFLVWKGVKIPKTTTRGKAALKRYLEEYIKIGGFPEVVKKPTIMNTYISSLYSSIISKDIILRHNLKYVKTFKEMSTTIISNFSNLISYNKLKNTHDIKSVHTAKNYGDYLSEAYLVQLVDKYSSKPKEVMNSPKKVYVIDCGLINTISHSVSENFGRLMENIVYLDLMRRRSIDRKLKIYYWRDYQSREIDFVLQKGKKIDSLIQVTKASGSDEVERREIKSLLKGAELLKCKNLKIITWDYEDESIIDKKKIEFIPVWKWLLDLT
ncbi:MAG: ATP-binding protein [Thermoplasmata archaeon]|nr:MAG: ATP-binding protein [Thermoplasmata archaeon]